MPNLAPFSRRKQRPWKSLRRQPEFATSSDLLGKLANAKAT
jgi:hypothetical protein